MSLLARTERDVVRRFVKPVTDEQVERAPDGAVLALSGQARQRGRTEAATGARVRRGLPRLPADQRGAPREPHASASVRSSRWAASRQRSCAWRTPACTTAAETQPPPSCSGGRRSMRSVRIPSTSSMSASPIMAKSAKSRWACSRKRWRSGPSIGGIAARADRLGPGPEAGHHLLRVEPGHGGQRRGCAGDERRASDHPQGLGALLSPDADPGASPSSGAARTARSARQELRC